MNPIISYDCDITLTYSSHIWLTGLDMGINDIKYSTGMLFIVQKMLDLQPCDVSKIVSIDSACDRPCRCSCQFRGYDQITTNNN